MRARRALADTSVLVGVEVGRITADSFAGDAWAVSAVTIGELRLGVLRATDPETTSARLATYLLARQFDPLVVDEAVADAWAVLLPRLRMDGRRMPVNDNWIAATAIAHDVPVVTRDADYDDVPRLTVIRL